VKIFLDPPLSGKENMARDLAMLETASQNREVICRFYSWDSPTISLGYFQKPEKVLHLDVLEKYGVKWVKRPTGGRAVFHYREITYAVALPADYPNLPQGITGAYRFISEPIYKAFLRSNLPVKWARQEKNTTEACFLAPSRHEILLKGHKIVGSAQRRIADAVLQHGSILLDAQPEIFAKCLKDVDEELLIRQLRKRTMVIPVDQFTLQKNLIREFRRYYS